MARDEIRIEDLVKDPVLLDTIRRTIEQARKNVDDAQLNYRFVMQMLPESQALPTLDMITLIVARQYAQAMSEWDHRDMMLPITFAVLTVREITRHDA